MIAVVGQPEDSRRVQDPSSSCDRTSCDSMPGAHIMNDLDQPPISADTPVVRRNLSRRNETGLQAGRSPLPNIHAVASTTPNTMIVSIGYEQRSLEDVIALLRRSDVRVVVDVRLNPISRKKGFSKSSLGQALGEANIEYRHERELGNPKSNRDPFRKGLKSARTRYLLHLQNGASKKHREVIELARTTRVALLCFERDHHECHRSSIVEHAMADHPELTVIEL